MKDLFRLLNVATFFVKMGKYVLSSVHNLL